jgi:acetolactate synthase-1/2/3 large subunit
MRLGVPGKSFLAVLDGFHAYRDRIRFITARHEGGACFMAEAAGKLTGRPGVCFVTRGPGATNASIGIHTAYQDSTPLVLFVDNVGSEFRDREVFQELDFKTFFGPTTGGMAKRVERIDTPERLPEYITRAFATAMNSRPKPRQANINPRRETLFKSSNNTSHDHDGQNARIGLMLNLSRQLDQAVYGLSQYP